MVGKRVPTDAIITSADRPKPAFCSLLARFCGSAYQQTHVVHSRDMHCSKSREEAGHHEAYCLSDNKVLFLVSKEHIEYHQGIFRVKPSHHPNGWLV